MLEASAFEATERRRLIKAAAAMNNQLQPNAQEAWEVINRTWLQGRKVLVVLGAGVSKDAEVPAMDALFTNLQRRIQQIQMTTDPLWKDPLLSDAFQKTRCTERLTELSTQLGGLAKNRAEQAMASMALGSLQRAGALSATTPLEAHLRNLWLTFTKDFIDRKITKAGDTLDSPPSEGRKPSDFHELVASMVIGRQAYVVSLNFDGLTFRALQDKLRKRGEGGPAAVVLSHPDELRRYFTGEDIEGPIRKQSLVPVVKVWGDVFHAVCKNPQCPEYNAKIPAFILEQQDDASNRHDCPLCHASRQLQIFFTGYEEKEKTTTELMKELHRYIAPEIGCLLTVGFSGLWDEALMDFLCVLAVDLQREQRNREGLTESEDEWHIKGSSGNSVGFFRGV